MKRLAPFVAMVVYIVTVSYLCFAQFDNVQDLPRTILGVASDKIVHFVMFLPYPILVYWMIGGRRDRMWKAILLVVLIFLSGALLAAGTELIQGYISYRSSDPLDFRADSIALALSSLIVTLIENHRLIR